ncbi:MAG: 50S ribosomal protein L24 [Planctomycetota bacterium]
MRLRKGDKVVIIAGEDKGKGPVPVLKVFPEQGKVLVEGVNVKTKHLRKTQENPQGGITKKEYPIPVSNVLMYSEKLEKGVRTRIEVKDGKKSRVGIPCGTDFG